MSQTFKLIIVNTVYSKVIMKKSTYVPSIGSAIDGLYAPMPKITSIINWPEDSTLSSLGVPENLRKDVDALLLVE